ncbi:GCN5 family acetyltransferase [Kouleothrix aurantiaca]|uniref:GCN5 family acetyltransferase n=1 Tax=Kouleothrix aurantiaca TaxID=186479 RepID=A0A0P9HFK8_9CHLR|nr:GCN5 family acetyltransferase [Kouleothrix aurantiaca]
MPSHNAGYQISTMTRGEVEIAIDWASREGWNPGLHDAACFYAADPQGFLLGKLNGEAISTISAVKYGDNFGFIGLYIVEKRFRHQGHGIQIWDRALADLKGRAVGLDGVVAQQENYKRSGFALAHRNIRYAGTSAGAGGAEPTCVSLADIAFADLATYDRRFFPAQRDAFLNAWVSQPQSHALGIVENGQLSGYGVIRACQAGYKIGPLNAESPGIAATLFAALVGSIPPGATFYLDVPEPNRQAVALAQSHGMTPSFETARMYIGAAPALPLGKIFGITSFELG